MHEWSMLLRVERKDHAGFDDKEIMHPSVVWGIPNS